jgi:methionine aminopeptidase
MEQSKFNKYQEASKILNEVLDDCKKLCNDKYNISFICRISDELVNTRLSKIFNKKKLEKSVVLPTCISVNNIISHNTFDIDNDYKLKDGDIIRIEMACHIDNNIVSIGDTIKINDLDFINSKLMNAAKLAMKIGINNITPDMNISEFEKVVSNVAKCFDLRLVERPNVFHEHDAKLQFDWVHRDNGVFNEPSFVVRHDHELDLEGTEFMDDEFEKNSKFKVGEVYHLSILLTDSKKKEVLSKNDGKLYQKTIRWHGLKTKLGKELINNITSINKNNFFKLSDIDMSLNNIRFGMKECIKNKLVRRLDLIELKEGECVMLKCSVVIQDNSVFKLTGFKMINMEKDDDLSEELNDIIIQSNKFVKRENYML